MLPSKLVEKKTIKTESAMFCIPNRNHSFSRRENELKEIRDIINSSSVVKEGDSSKIVTISGLGGVGKTSLALEATWEM